MEVRNSTSEAWLRGVLTLDAVHDMEDMNHLTPEGSIGMYAAAIAPTNKEQHL